MTRPYRLALTIACVLLALSTTLYATSPTQLLPHLVKGKYGYVNHSGEIVIKPKFQSAEPFKHNYAIVEQRELWGIITLSGDYVVEPKYGSLKFAHKGTKTSYYIASLSGRYGTFAVQGNESLQFIPFHYDYIESHDNCFILTKSGKRGIIDSSNKLNIPCNYDTVTPCDGGFILTQNGKYAFASSDGKLLTDCIYDAIEPIALGLKLTLKGKLGVINKTGKVILNYAYDSIEPHDHGYTITNGNKHGLLSELGVVVIPCEYNSIDTLDKGYIVTKNGLKGFLLSNGNIALDCTYRDLIITENYIIAQEQSYADIYSFKHLGVINTFNCSSLTKDPNGYIVEYNGKYALLPDNDLRKTSNYYDSMHRVERGYVVTSAGKYGFITSCGSEQLAPKLYNLDLSLSEGTQVAMSDNEIFVIESLWPKSLTHWAASNHNPWNLDYAKAEGSATVYSGLIATNEAKRSTSNFEEDIHFDTYTHTQVYETIHCSDLALHFIKHQIDGNYYLIIKSSDQIKAKIECGSLGLTYTEHSYYGDYETLPRLSAWVVLSNGNILLESSYQHKSGKYVSIIDTKSFEVLQRVPLGNCQIVGVSKFDGWYIAQDKTTLCSIDKSLSKYSNTGKYLWSYQAKDGEFFTTLIETDKSLYLGGYTTKRGYIGKQNPIICRLDTKTGYWRDEKCFKIANSNYGVYAFDGDQALVAPSEASYSYSGYNKQSTTKHTYAELEPIKCELVCTEHLGITAYGLLNESGQWLITPVLPGEQPRSYYGWTIHSCDVTFDTQSRALTFHTTPKVEHNGEPMYTDSSKESSDDTTTPSTTGSIIYLTATEEMKVPHINPDRFGGHALEIAEVEIEEVVENIIEEEIFVVAEVMPTFQGGDLSKFRNWVQSNVKYPQSALENGIQGNVVVKFVIEKDGKLSNIQVLQAPDKTLADAVVQVLQKSPKWKPGKKRDKPVRVTYTLPVSFTIGQ